MLDLLFEIRRKISLLNAAQPLRVSRNYILLRQYLNFAICYIFCAIYIKVAKGNKHKNEISDCKSCENHHIEEHTGIWGRNDTLS